MNNNVYIACLIKNSISIICFTVLSIIFNKWWIILFSALFLSNIQTKKQFFRICDICGKHSTYANDYNESLDKAKKDGWICDVDKNKDYCPECQNKEKGI